MTDPASRPHGHHDHAHHDHGHDSHEHDGHEHEERVSIDGQIRRLKLGAYGDVADAQNDLIWSKVGYSVGPVLEIGCGCARLIATDPVPERLSIGLDIDLASLKAAREAWDRPNTHLVCGSAFALPFADRAIETVILRESIHHLKTAGSHDVILREAARVCGKRLIVFDPNMNVVQKLGRRLIRFRDDETRVSEILAFLHVIGFRPVSIEYRDLIAFPLSGGLVAREYFPRTSPVWKVIVRADRAITKLLDRTPRLTRFLCWRYLLVAERISP
jgi:SAM-dependent methyltransferase